MSILRAIKQDLLNELPKLPRLVLYSGLGIFAVGWTDAVVRGQMDREAQLFQLKDKIDKIWEKNQKLILSKDKPSTSEESQIQLVRIERLKAQIDSFPAETNLFGQSGPKFSFWGIKDRKEMFKQDLAQIENDLKNKLLIK